MATLHHTTTNAETNVIHPAMYIGAVQVFHLPEYSLLFPLPFCFQAGPDRLVFCCGSCFSFLPYINHAVITSLLCGAMLEFPTGTRFLSSRISASTMSGYFSSVDRMLSVSKNTGHGSAAIRSAASEKARPKEDMVRATIRSYFPAIIST